MPYNRTSYFDGFGQDYVEIVKKVFLATNTAFFLKQTLKEYSGSVIAEP